MLAAAGAFAVAPAIRGDDAKPKSAARFCLNTSTIRDANGKPRPLAESIRIAAEAGYQAIEPWIAEIQEFAKTNSLAELKKRIADAGLVVPDAIGFAEWIVDDSGRRAKGLEQAKRDMDLVKQIGGTRLAAPPVGATGGQSPRDDPKASQSGLDLIAAADRYRALLELGQSMGVTPIVELWGFSRNVHRLGQAVLIATECGKEGGGILPDIYHLYKGGSDFAGLKLLAGHSIGIFHVNDYPAIDRAKIVDADRVYPGDGVAPVKAILASLTAIGYSGFLSLELFNRGYWKEDPMVVAKTGLAKLKAQL
jgi:sugar phosphate isomerase/epimerase